jgi:hypothetical protein
LEKFISTNGILENIHYYRSQYFFDLEEIIFENFNNSENNMRLKEKICFKMNFFFLDFSFHGGTIVLVSMLLTMSLSNSVYYKSKA